MTDIRILSLFRERFVRIFNLIWFISISLLLGQGELIKIHSISNDDVMDTLVTIIQQDSNPSIEFILESFSTQSNIALYTKIDHQKKVDTLIVISSEKINLSILDQIGSPLKVATIGFSFNKVRRSILDRYYFLYREPSVDIGIVRDEYLGAIIKIDPEFESHFSGIIGMGKRGTSWDLTGEIDLHLENLFETAGMYELYWKRVDSLSQVIRFNVYEPHPFGWDLGVHWNYHHEVIKGLYSIIENQTMLQMFIPGLHLMNLGYSSGKTIPTEKGEKNGYDKVGFKAFKLSSFRDSRNNRFFPKDGMMLFGSVDIGLQSGHGFIESEIEFNFFNPISNNIHRLIKFSGKGITNLNYKIPKSRYYLYGGSSTLRGYLEQQFSSTQYFISSLELAYQPDNTIQFNLFLDYGNSSLNNVLDGYLGYGFGIAQKSDQSIIKVQYALPSGQTLNQGKLHIKWISRL